MNRFVSRLCLVLAMSFGVLTLSPAGATRGRAAAASESAPHAATPEQLVANLIAAAQKGDVDGYLANLTADSRKALSESSANRDALRAAEENFRNALDQRFGASAEVITSPPEDMKAALGALAGAEVLGKTPSPGGAVQIRVKTSLRTADGRMVTREDTLAARREGGAWRLVLGLAPDGQRAAAQLAAIKQVTEKVKSGEYKDRESAMIALSDAESAKGGAAK